MMIVPPVRFSLKKIARIGVISPKLVRIRMSEIIKNFITLFICFCCVFIILRF